MKKQVALLSTLCVLGFLIGGCKAQKAPEVPANKQGTHKRMTPQKGDALADLMDRNLANLEYLLYGYINFDAFKIKKSTDNFIALGKAMEKKIPQRYKKHEKAWKKHCQKHEKIAREIAEAFKADEYHQGTKLLSELVINCMNCHKLYKPGVAGKLLPVE